MHTMRISAYIVRRITPGRAVPVGRVPVGVCHVAFRVKLPYHIANRIVARPCLAVKRIEGLFWPGCADGLGEGSFIVRALAPFCHGPNAASRVLRTAGPGTTPALHLPCPSRSAGCYLTHPRRARTAHHSQSVGARRAPDLN